MTIQTDITNLIATAINHPKELHFYNSIDPTDESMIILDLSIRDTDLTIILEIRKKLYNKYQPLWKYKRKNYRFNINLLTDDIDETIETILKTIPNRGLHFT